MIRDGVYDMTHELPNSSGKSQKIIKLLGDADSESLKFLTRKWYAINDQNNAK